MFVLAGMPLAVSLGVSRNPQAKRTRPALRPKHRHVQECMANRARHTVIFVVHFSGGRAVSKQYLRRTRNLSKLEIAQWLGGWRFGHPFLTCSCRYITCIYQKERSVWQHLSKQNWDQTRSTKGSASTSKQAPLAVTNGETPNPKMQGQWCIMYAYKTSVK